MPLQGRNTPFRHGYPVNPDTVFKLRVLLRLIASRHDVCLVTGCGQPASEILGVARDTTERSRRIIRRGETHRQPAPVGPVHRIGTKGSRISRSELAALPRRG
jgi:hypothetical protein